MESSRFFHVLFTSALLCLVGVFPANAQDTTTGLEGYWNFDGLELGSTTATDSSDNGRDATVGAGQPVPVAGKVGNAAFFDGSSDFLVPWKGIEGNNPRTISLWVKTTDTGDGMVGWGIANDGEKWHFRINDDSGTGVLGALRTEIQGDRIVGTNVVNDDEWHHVVSVFEGEFQGDTIHYVDGELDPMTGLGPNDLPVNTNITDGSDVTIGSRTQDGTSFDRMIGILDEVRIYSRALSAEDVQALYEEGQVEQAFTTRSFANDFVAVGNSVEVTLSFESPATGTLTETIPEGWSASDISDGGSLDGNTITWELTGDVSTVSYSATPNEEDAESVFTGQFNGIFTAGDINITLLLTLDGELNFHADIGDIQAPGSANFDGSLYMVEGAGADIGGTADAFHFAFTELEGPFRMAISDTFVLPLESDSEGVKGGLMVRNNLTPESSNAYVHMDGFGENDLGIRWQQRLTQGDTTTAGQFFFEQDGQMIVEREGNIVRTFTVNFEGEQELLGEHVLSDLQDPLYAGIAITSNSIGNLSSIEAIPGIPDLNIDFIELLPQSVTRNITLDGQGLPTFGDTFNVTLNIFFRSQQDIAVTETIPEGWTLGNVETSFGTASASDGTIEWNIGGHQGNAILNYQVTAPAESTEIEIVGEFTGEANGNEFTGDTSAIVRGIVPQEILDQQDIESALAGYWTFDEGEGTVAADSSGNNRNAEVQSGEPVWVEGVQGTALQFDGEDDNLFVPDWWGIGGNTPRTVTCWIKSTATNTHGIVSWGLSSGSGQKYHVRINNNAGNGTAGAIRTEIQGTFNIGSTIINDDQWHFIASVFPEGGEFMVDVQHFIDGLFDSRSGTNDNGTTLPLDTAASPDVSDQEFRIGMRVQGEANHFYPGLIDEVRVYERGLTPLEIQAVFMEDGGPQDPTAVYDYMLY